MYIAELKKKQGSKIYKTILVRESYRDNGKVKHRTVANISKLPAEHIRQLKASLRGVKGDFKVSDLGVGRSYEYGGSFILRELAKDISATLTKMFNTFSSTDYLKKLMLLQLY